MTLLLGLSGSLRRGSYNRQLLAIAGSMTPAGTRLEIYDGLQRVPAYNDDHDPTPEPVAALRNAIADADALLIATPEYNSSIPGHLKNALDWASRPFPDNSLRGKPVAVIGASTGMFGAVWAQAELRKVLKTIGATIVGEELPVARVQEALADDGNLIDATIRHALSVLIGQLAATFGDELERSA